MSFDQPRSAAGSLGPRLLGRLTAELILRSGQYLNPLQQYEIDLRGNKISAIENLGATENQFDSIDLSDNAIVRLEGFPRLLRLKQLLLNNNRLARIAKGCNEPIPNVETLILTNNKLANLQDLDPLAAFTKLTMLSLVGNPVIERPNYRLYVISKCKALKVLDFKKVKLKEREESNKVFPTEEAAAAHGANTFDADAEYEAQTQAAQQGAGQPAPAQPAKAVAAPAAARKGPTPEQLIAIKAAIANAATLDEIRRLEEALTTGHLPSEFVIAAPASAPAAVEVSAQDPLPDMETSAPAVADVDMADAPTNGTGPESSEAKAVGDKPEEMAEG
mmetsp:Transcript_8650/g.14910  ORF Transcript_8650/g.14910 Transcript_8650/m.14910 type:complete len:333 (+) Transcript_8650:56-1054(+)|eukprot:CAMPEP_0119114692 /NCGR_PEP_ID=MMETSP1180-20130426/48291_1 /TAXON_ID=3052 ORGANISM="Chlamydomonas cf sp, Strain CCMP681" /NCGR_SAMPLE_ID=MMETSP1180 /ASSEMBLY_ACC=CAM_ASM_000741 /LENGTH=332 /DNA_ID=CAMNT_0007103345 /DNA_START=37 /DNA_END=1035 /DNA_ORIENTATION=+